MDLKMVYSHPLHLYYHLRVNNHHTSNKLLNDRTNEDLGDSISIPGDFKTNDPHIWYT